MFVSCSPASYARRAAGGSAVTLQQLPCTTQKLRIGRITRDGRPAAAADPISIHAAASECVGTCPAVGILGTERFGSRLGPVRRLGPILQIQVLDTCQSKRRLSAKCLVCRRIKCMLGGRIRLRRAQERLACVLGEGCRACPRNLLSGGIVAIGRGERLQDLKAVRTGPERRKIEDSNGCRPGGPRVFLAGHPDKE